MHLGLTGELIMGRDGIGWNSKRISDCLCITVEIEMEIEIEMENVRFLLPTYSIDIAISLFRFLTPFSLLCHTSILILILVLILNLG